MLQLLTVSCDVSKKRQAADHWQTDKSHEKALSFWHQRCHRLDVDALGRGACCMDAPPCGCCQRRVKDLEAFPFHDPGLASITIFPWQKTLHQTISPIKTSSCMCLDIH